jgi:hypothetical protein
MAVGMIGGPRLCEPLLATGLGRFTGGAREQARYRPSEKNISPFGEAVGFQAHRNALRQTRSELLLSPVPRCRRGILALVVRGFRFWDNMASVSAPG